MQFLEEGEEGGGGGGGGIFPKCPILDPPLSSVISVINCQGDTRWHCDQPALQLCSEYVALVYYYS